MSSISRIASAFPALLLAFAAAHCGGSITGSPTITDGDAAVADGMADGGTSVDATPLFDSSIDVLQPADDAATTYEWLRGAMVGTWRGVRTDPWEPPADVLIHLDAAGRYTAHCTDQQASDPCVWHYGTDQDLPGKTYELVTLTGNGKGSGRILIAFSATETRTGAFDSLVVDPTGMTMTFDFYPAWLGALGPVHFTLTRVLP